MWSGVTIFTTAMTWPPDPKPAPIPPKPVLRFRAYLLSLIEPAIERLVRPPERTRTVAVFARGRPRAEWKLKLWKQAFQGA